jgi:GntR family transcriptional repressor for pyruvate dehydrogenase complex
MKGLQLLGIIRSRQGDGSFLANATTDFLRAPLEFAIAFKGKAHQDLKHDLFEARQAIEVKLSALAARRRTQEDLHHMREALAGMKASKGSPDHYCEHGLHFHNCIAHASKNAVMISIIEMLSGMLIQSRRESVRLLTDYEESYLGHELIFLRIQTRDAEGAAEATREHFRRMENRASIAGLTVSPPEEERGGTQ